MFLPELVVSTHFVYTNFSGYDCLTTKPSTKQYNTKTTSSPFWCFRTDQVPNDLIIELCLFPREESFKLYRKNLYKGRISKYLKEFFLYINKVYNVALNFPSKMVIKKLRELFFLYYCRRGNLGKTNE